MANQLTTRGSWPAGMGTSTVAWQVGQADPEPGGGLPLEEERLSTAVAEEGQGRRTAPSYGVPALTWEAPDAYIAASFPPLQRRNR